MKKFFKECLNDYLDFYADLAARGIYPHVLGE